MEPQNGVTQEFAVEVGVEFCGGNRLVAQHFLNGLQIGAAFTLKEALGASQGVLWVFPVYVFQAPASLMRFIFKYQLCTYQHFLTC